MLEKKQTGKKGIQIRGGRGTRGTRKGCQNRKNREKGYPNRYMIRVLAMRSYLERVYII